MEKIENIKYSLYTWPDSQRFVSEEQAILVLPDARKGIELDSSYMVPRHLEPMNEQETVIDETLYIRVEQPEAQHFLYDEQMVLVCIADYDGNVFVPEKIWDKWNEENEKIRQAMSLLKDCDPCLVLNKVPDIEYDAIACLHGQLVDALTENKIKTINLITSGLSQEDCRLAGLSTKTDIFAEVISARETPNGKFLVIYASEEWSSKRTRETVFNELGLNDALRVRDICFNIIGRINSDLLILTDNGETAF